MFVSAQEAGSCCDSEEEQEEEEEVQSTERAGADQRYDEQMDEAAEEEGLKRYREARANEMFPDEVDTPLDTPARIRSVLLLLLSRMRNKCVCEFKNWIPLHTHTLIHIPVLIQEGLVEVRLCGKQISRHTAAISIF